MAQALASQGATPERLKRNLAAVSATSLVGGMQKVTRTVMREGAVVITRHDEPTMVLLSVERYLELERAAEPNLDALTQRFDDLFARMQGEQPAQGMADAFAMSPAELGDAAVQAAKGRSKAARRKLN